MDNEKSLLWFAWDCQFPNETGTFLQNLRVAAGRWSDADPRHARVYQRADRLVLGLDVPDCARCKIVRNLRIDYGPFGLIHGEDDTGQYVTKLTPAQDEYGCLAHTGRSPADLGRAAAAWFRQCAQKARITSGGRNHPDSCRFDLVAGRRFVRVTGWIEAL